MFQCIAILKHNASKKLSVLSLVFEIQTNGKY